MPLDFDILGQGIYSPTQAARLVGTKASEILRWTKGTSRNEPLWTAHYRALDDSNELSFLDVLELRVVKQLRRAGLSLQAIRFAISVASEKFGVERPLASKRFATDGYEIFMGAIEEDGNLVSLSKSRPGQKVFSAIVDQSLRDLEFDDGAATRWRPRGARDVVIDPKRQFGAPLLDQYGISTSMLRSEMSAFEDAGYLAKIYEIPVGLVRQAVRYEQDLDKAVGQGSV